MKNDRGRKSTLKKSKGKSRFKRPNQDKGRHGGNFKGGGRQGVGSWIVGKHSVTETLLSKRVKVLTLFVLQQDRGKHADLERMARRAGAKVQLVNRKELDRVAEGLSHQGLAARVLEKKGVGLSDYLVSLTDKQKAGTVLVALDQIQDPHNVGAIARSAACLGAAGIIFPDRRASPITPTVVQVSAGAVQRIRTFQVGNLAQTLDKLKEAGFWIYGADMGGTPLPDAQLNMPMVLVIGSEGKGIRPLVKQKCDEVVAIPQSSGGVDSLNASCAASVMLYEAARQRVG
jgi:23S rRNA (guanosine2251-2'-O)-methyltransferase